MPHTPGPWFVDRTQDSQAWSGSFAIGSADGGHVCHTTRDVVATSLADAHLIAAAPELLDALRSALDEIQGDNVGAVIDVLESKGRAAIAKAEGRS